MQAQPGFGMLDLRVGPMQKQTSFGSTSSQQSSPPKKKEFLAVDPSNMMPQWASQDPLKKPMSRQTSLEKTYTASRRGSVESHFKSHSRRASADETRIGSQRRNSEVHPANTVPFRGAGSSDVNLSSVLNIVRKLLLAHEVRFALDFLEALGDAAISKLKLPMDMSDMEAEINCFIIKQKQSNGHSFEAGPLYLLGSLLSSLGSKSKEHVGSARHVSEHEAPCVLAQHYDWSSTQPRKHEKLETLRGRLFDEASRYAGKVQTGEIRSVAHSRKNSVDSSLSHYEQTTMHAWGPLETEYVEAPGPAVNEQAAPPNGTPCSFAYHETRIEPLEDGLNNSTEDVPTANFKGNLHWDDVEPSGFDDRSMSSTDEEQAPRPVQQTLFQQKWAANRSKPLQLDQVRVEKKSDLDDLSQEQIVWLATPSDACVMHPNGRHRVLWDLFVVFAILVESIAVPISIGFSLQLPRVIQVMLLVFFCIDLTLSFNTGYFHRSLLVMRRDWLSMKYLRTWFLVDFVSTVPWDTLLGTFILSIESLSSGANETTMIRVVKLGKLARVLRLVRSTKLSHLLRQLQDSGVLSTNMFEVKFGSAAVKMFVSLALLSHWSACLWGWLGDPTLYSGHSNAPIEMDSCSEDGPCELTIVGSPWKRRFGMEHFDGWTQYLVALQFTASLITGGETSVSPGHAVERVFVVLMMFCSTLICSIVVGEVLLIMEKTSEANLTYDMLMKQSKDFMVARGVPLELQVRVHRYLENQHNAQNGYSGSNRSFMTSLSEWLQIELVELLNSKQIFQHPFFQGLDDEQARRRICLEAKPILYAAGDFVVEEGHVARSMHFLVRGKVHVEINKEHRGDVYLRPPYWIGDKCLFLDTLRTNTVRAVQASETLQVDKASLDDCCDEFADVKIKHQQFRQQIIDNQGEMLRCPVCQDIGHIAENCAKRRRDSSDSRSTVPKVRENMFALLPSTMFGP